MGLPDLELPAWGPYTKKYLGISHVTARERGLRFDLAVFPGLYRRRVDVPRVTWESGYHPWEASADLNYFSHRHELEWKDQVYADISFSPVDESVRLVRAELVNATNLPQSLTLHLMASLHFPPVRTYSEEVLEPGTVVVPPGVTWVPALDYTVLTFAHPRPDDHLGPDGLWRAEARESGFVAGQAIGQGWGRDQGDTVGWDLPATASAHDAVLLHLRVASGTRFEATLKGAKNTALSVVGSGEFISIVVALQPGATSLKLHSNGGAAVEIDGLAFGPTSRLTDVTFGRTVWNPVAESLPGPHETSLILRYDDSPLCYGLAWQDEGEVRQFHVAELDRYLRHYVHEHVKKEFHAPGNEHFTNVYLRPLTVAPQSTRVVWALVATGTEAEVRQRLAVWPDAESVWRQARTKACRAQGNAAGEAYRFSQDRLAATLLTNVVFPVYTRRQYIRHFTPGKWWDCLYTWDSGFIGLGFLELDTMRAVENLKAYLTDPGDDHAAFLHHGSPVPVQFALFHEVWNRTGDAQLLAWAYPRLKQYYRFLAGFEGGSTTATLASGLRKTWDYFYNSGGWDDYPAQVEVHQKGLEATVAPVISTAQAALCAHLLATMADALGLAEDVEDYRANGQLFEAALQTHSWDDEAGCFSYVVHDTLGQPVGHLRHASGQNFNRGLDGFYPLVAGLATEEQERRLIADLESERFWTPVGLSTVDRTAPYYRIDGYWNGAVWMAHQWYFWKALLDLGRGDFAWKIAQTALENARRETDETYCCFEHWVIESGRGAGWHQFGGLSAPLLTWYAASFVPGRISTGFQLRVVTRTPLARGGWSFSLKASCLRPRRASVLMVLPAGQRYRAQWNGSEVALEALTPGAWLVNLPLVPNLTSQLEFTALDS